MYIIHEVLPNKQEVPYPGVKVVLDAEGRQCHYSAITGILIFY
jgi:hypothetical protein